MSEAHSTVKQRIRHGMTEFVLSATYLFVVFSLFALYKSVVLNENRMALLPIGLSLVNALALAKVILVGQELHLAEQLTDAPLIYSAILKSFVYTLVLTIFKLLEEVGLGLHHGQSIGDSLVMVGGGSWRGVAVISLLLFVVLIPFFAFTELRRVLGDDRLFGLFFSFTLSAESAAQELVGWGDTRRRPLPSTRILFAGSYPRCRLCQKTTGHARVARTGDSTRARPMGLVAAYGGIALLRSPGSAGRWD